MAQYESRVVTTRRKEYVLKLPTDYIEVEKMMAAIRQANSAVEFPWVEVTATEEELVFSYGMDKQVRH